MGLKNWEGNCPPFFRKDGVYVSVKQDKAPVRTASDLERKYQFGKQFAEIMGIALDAQNTVTKVDSELRHEILEQYSSITRTTDEIKMEVAEVTKTTEEIQKDLDDTNVQMEGLRTTVTEKDSEIRQTAEQISLRVNEVTKITEEIQKEVADTNTRVEELRTTMTDKDSEILQTAEQISLRVGEVSQTTEEIRQYVDDTNDRVDETNLRVDDLADIRTTMVEKDSEILQTAEQIALGVAENYVEKSTFDEYTRNQAAELLVWKEGIEGLVTKTEESIENVNGDLQEKFNTITKYFTFNIDGLTIGQVDNPNKVIIDNDEVTIMVGNFVVQTFKADGTALVPTLNVTKQANIVGLAVTETATHINVDYVGVVTSGN